MKAEFLKFARALNLPRAARVLSSSGGAPHEVNGERIDAVPESWLVEDRWWTDSPLRRRYWELVSVRGRNLVVFHDLRGGGRDRVQRIRCAS